jgi:hypothetical protein
MRLAYLRPVEKNVQEMRRVSFVLVAVTLLAVVGTSFYTRGRAQSQAPLPARSRAEETLGMWNSIGNKLIAMAKDFPEEKYDFRLQKDQRTFAQTLLHGVGVDYLLMRTVFGSNIGPDLGKDVINASRDVYQTKADVLNLIQQAVADGANGAGQNDEFSVWLQAGPQFLPTGCSSSRTAASTTAGSWPIIAPATWCRRNRGCDKAPSKS